MNKQPEITAQTKKNLTDAYFSLKQNGKKATVGQVAELAGYNRCTFYRYFTDTEDLRLQAEAELCSEFKNAALNQISKKSLTELVSGFACIYEKHGKYLETLLGEYGDPNFSKMIKAQIYPFAKQIFKGKDAVTDIKIEFALSAVLAAVTKWYQLGKPISETELGTTILYIFQNGLFNY